MQDEVKVLTPTGMFGYGFPLEWFRKGLDLKPDAIIADSGSTDSGPQKLGLGAMTCSRDAYMKDLAMVLEAGSERKIPVIISSAGGDGTDAHVDAFVEMARGHQPAQWLSISHGRDLRHDRQGAHLPPFAGIPHPAARPSARVDAG